VPQFGTKGTPCGSARALGLEDPLVPVGSPVEIYKKNRKKVSVFFGLFNFKVSDFLIV